MPADGLIVGLGNPGAKYAGTRHNTGFDFLDEVMRAMNGLATQSCKFQGDLWKGAFDGIPKTFLCVKPLTFMNLSGDCVQPLAAWHRIPPSAILVLHDELDLDPGRLKFKIGGGNAGHNGLKSITERLGTPDFARLRIGIGRGPSRDDTVGWVLGRPPMEIRELMASRIPDVIRCVRAWASGDIQTATAVCNKTK